MKYARHGTLQGFKKNGEHDSEDESRKKPRIGPTTVSPAQKPGKFMQSILYEEIE